MDVTGAGTGPAAGTGPGPGGAVGAVGFVRIVLANEASWQDLEAVVGAARCHGGLCYCQRLKLPAAQWQSVGDEERAHLLREQTDCGRPGSDPRTTSGLVAYVDGEPAGWCAVEPRTAYRRLTALRVPWAGRSEDKADDGVWAVSCLLVRPAHRGRHLTYALTRAAVDVARRGGARALEGYPMITRPGTDIAWGELHVGSHTAFAAAGFREVSRPTERRAVMRVDFDGQRA